MVMSDFKYGTSSIVGYILRCELELSEDLTIAPPWRYEWTKIYRSITLFEKLMVHNNPGVDLISDKEFTKFVVTLLQNCKTDALQSQHKS